MYLCEYSYTHENTNINGKHNGASRMVRIQFMHACGEYRIYRKIVAYILVYRHVESIKTLSEISGSHGGEYEDDCFLVC
jgi:hypothetical protein